MLESVDTDPWTLHLKNRGIVYRCEKFEFDNSKNRPRIAVPDLIPEQFEDLDDGDPKYGIADGGHTFEVIQQTVARQNELLEREGWTETFVRVRRLIAFRENEDKKWDIREIIQRMACFFKGRW